MDASRINVRHFDDESEDESDINFARIPQGMPLFNRDILIGLNRSVK
jgi:hypothetical protein